MTVQQGTRQLLTQAPGNPQVGKDSVLVTRSQFLQWSLEGRLFHAQQGNDVTKLDWVETAYDEDQPQLALIVPIGTLMVPISMAITIEDPPQDDIHCTWGTTTNDIDVNTAAAELTVTKLKTHGTKDNKVRVGSLWTSNSTALEGLFEVQRWYRPFNENDATDQMKGEDFLWHYSKGPMPTLVGPATLVMHIFSGTDGPQGFGEYVWAEFETGEFPE